MDAGRETRQGGSIRAHTVLPAGKRLAAVLGMLALLFVILPAAWTLFFGSNDYAEAPRNGRADTVEPSATEDETGIATSPADDEDLSDPAPSEPAEECDPNYEGACVDPAATDVDCQGGSGDGPEYVGVVEVVGDDWADLDRDGDGVACEPWPPPDAPLDYSQTTPNAPGAPRSPDVSGWTTGTGTHWDDFVDGFAAGWLEGCTNTARLGGGDALYYGNTAVDEDDCTFAAPWEPDPAAVPLRRPADPFSEGYDLGENAACVAFFDELGPPGSRGVLFYGNLAYSNADCPADRQAPDVVRDCPDIPPEPLTLVAGFTDVSVRNVTCESARSLILDRFSDVPTGADAAAGFTCVTVEGTDAGWIERCATAGGLAYRYSVVI